MIHSIYKKGEAIKQRLEQKHINSLPEELRSGYFKYSKKFSDGVDALNIASFPFLFNPYTAPVAAPLLGGLNYTQFLGHSLPRYLLYGRGDGRLEDAILDGFGIMPYFKTIKMGSKIYPGATKHANDFISTMKGLDFITDSNNLVFDSNK